MTAGIRFLLVFGAGALVLSGAASPSHEIAVTFDDLPGVVAPDQGLMELQSITEKLVSTIKRANVPVVGFVNEGKLAPEGSVDPGRVALLRTWIEAGLELGNHTFSHIDLHRTSLETFEEDVIRGEALIRPLLEKRGLSLRYFRHPFLHTGRSLEIRSSLEAFLARRGYRVAPVTIDDSDWIFAKAFANANRKGDGARARAIAAAYPPYIESKIDYYQRQSVALFSREIPQVLLLHANVLNAEFFGELVRRMRSRGYKFVSLDRALADPAYGSRDTFTGAGGISWLHRWALSLGDGTVLPGEPATPPFVMEAAGVSEE